MPPRMIWGVVSQAMVATTAAARMPKRSMAPRALLPERFVGRQAEAAVADGLGNVFANVESTSQIVKIDALAKIVARDRRRPAQTIHIRGRLLRLVLSGC